MPVHSNLKTAGSKRPPNLPMFSAVLNISDFRIGENVSSDTLFSLMPSEAKEAELVRINSAVIRQLQRNRVFFRRAGLSFHPQKSLISEVN